MLRFPLTNGQFSHECWVLDAVLLLLACGVAVIGVIASMCGRLEAWCCEEERYKVFGWFTHF